MKILFAHIVHSFGLEKWYDEIARAASDGLEISCFCVTLNPPGPGLSWSDLDRRWRQKDKSLLEMYTRLREAASDFDVLLLYNGVNIHPEFLQYLPTFNVFCCFDDPESSANLSEPVASAFDGVFYGNIASRFQYEHWGCRNLAWLPIFTAPSDVPSRDDGARQLDVERDIEISIVCDKTAERRRRLEMLSGAFPQAKCFGKNWISGRIDDEKLHKLYRRSKIGWNVHNSTGPINRRLFALPAFGILQICDNKTGLGQIFRLGEEVVGFDTIPEAIELTRCYLKNEDERKRVAANGFRRYWEDYHPAAIWRRIHRQLDEWMTGCNSQKQVASIPERNTIDLLRPFVQEVACVLGSLTKSTLKVIREYRDSMEVSTPERDERVYLEEKVIPYIENPEMYGVNMARERLAKGEPFEWPNMLALNWAVTALIRNAKRIIEIGSGTGPFAELSSLDPKRQIDCFEEDDFAREWAEKNRAHPNVTFRKHIHPTASSTYDLLVSLDVFEHVVNMRGFLDLCGSWAPRAVFSTPNRNLLSSPKHIGPPPYPPHVREFSPGEFLWILRQYYQHVFLYYMPDVHVPWLEPMNIMSSGTPIIAECHTPIYRRVVS
jgi:spore maturation protein CgeB